jgi:hypothetical protein
MPNDLTPHTSLSPIRRGFVNYKKGCIRIAAASDKVYQLLAHGRWFSAGSPTSSTTKTGRHDIAEILLKVALNTKDHSINRFTDHDYKMIAEVIFNCHNAEKVATLILTVFPGRIFFVYHC